MQYFFDHIFFKAFYPSPSMHKHFAKHMIFALDGFLHCKINGDECTCRGIVIQSNCMHTVLSDKTPILVYLFDETCKRAECLNELYLKGADYAVLPDALCDDVCTIVNEKVTEKKNGTEDDEKRVLQSCTDEKILKICGLERGGILEYDKRIRRVLDIIDTSESLEAGIMSALCKDAFLSESGLSHLFRTQVGISIASYLVFAKLSKTYRYVLSGESVTDAAVHAGFSSASHFAAVNKKLFGLSITELDPANKACPF